MRFYFKRSSRGDVSRARMYSYLSLMGALVSLLFLFRTTEPRVYSSAVLLTCVLLGVCIISTAIDLIQEVKRNSSCNVYDLLRLIVSIIICILVSTGCLK